MKKKKGIEQMDVAEKIRYFRQQKGLCVIRPILCPPRIAEHNLILAGVEAVQKVDICNVMDVFAKSQTV